jgi:hypothetical protein
MFFDDRKIRGQRCMVLKRCSSGPQIATSIMNQKKTTGQAITEFALTVVDEVDLEGVTGSVPGARDDIDRIITRKRTLNDFKVLLVQDATRFTRAGWGHGQKLLYELRAAGILVYFVAEELLVDDEMSEMYVSFLFGAARHAVKQLAYNGLAGSTNSFLDGKSPHTRRAPYGLDRMYTDNGVDRHIIRNLPDGTQQMLDPTTGAFIRPFGKNEKKGVPNHYIKQKAEQIRLVLGDPRFVAVVLLMFHLHYVEGWSFQRIAMHLNDNHVPSANGLEWHTDTVGKILRNPIYLGRGIRGRTKSGIYYITSADKPEPSNVTLEDLANNDHIPPERRSREHWLERPQPHLTEFLPEAVRGIAAARIEQYLESIADAKPPKPNRDRHRDHRYLLKGILRSKQGNHPMTGRVSGKKGKEKRRYAVARGESVPKSNNILKRRVPAQPLEDAMVAIVRDVVQSAPDLEAMLKHSILQNMKSVQDDTEKPEQVKKEIQRKQKQLALLTDDVQLDDDDVLTRKCNKIKAEIRALHQRLQIPQHKQVVKMDADAIAAKFAKELLASAGALGDPHNEQTFQLLELVVSRMEVDLETMEVDVDFAFPSWIGSVLQQIGPVGLDSLSAYKPRMEAHPENSIKIADFRCNHTGQRGGECFHCHRLRRAA